MKEPDVLEWVLRAALKAGAGPPPTGAAWLTGLEALQASRLASLGAWLLGPERGALPPEVQDRLRRSVGFAALAVDHTGAQLTELAARLQALGFAWVVLKGPSLAERLYPDPVCRPCRDVDLLVAPADVPAVTGLLAALGYQATTAEREAVFHVRHERSRSAGWTDVVELHWAPEPPGGSTRTAGDVLASRVEVASRWGRLWIPGPAAERDLLIRHYVRHAGWQAILLLDVLLHLDGQSLTHPLGSLLARDLARLGLPPTVSGPVRWRHRPLGRWMAARTFAGRRTARRAAPFASALALGAGSGSWLAAVGGLVWPAAPSARWQAMASSPWGRRLWRPWRLLTLGRGAPKPGGAG